MENLTGDQIDFLIANFLTPRDLILEEKGRMAMGINSEVFDMDDFNKVKGAFINQYGSRKLTVEFVDYLMEALGLK